MRSFIAMLMACVLAAGCASAQKIQGTIDTQSESLHQRRIEAMQVPLGQTDQVIQKVTGAWLGSGALPSTRSRALPASTREFVYTFGDRVGMSKIAERVTLITGIPVRLAPDVFMSMRALLSANGQMGFNQVGASGQAVPQATAAPASPSVNATGNYNQAYLAAMGLEQGDGTGYDPTFKGPYKGTLAGFLDLVCARGLSWEYRDDTLYISRLVTRTFIYRAPTLDTAKSTVSLGKTGSVTTGSSSSTSGSTSSGSYDGALKTSASVDMSPWTSLAKDIDAVKSPVGHYSIARESNTVVVTDLPEVVEKVAAIIERRNQAARRQVNLTLEIINATTSSSTEFGVDWTVVGQKMSGIAPEWSISFSSPASLVSSSVGTLAYKILDGKGGSANPRSMSGSSALLKALNQIGQANALLRTRRIAANNQPTSFALTDQGSYICGTTPAASSIGGTTGGTVGITQCTYTVGYTLTLTLTVLDNNRISVQGSFDFSELKKLSELVSAGQLVQQPLITDLADMLQASEVKSGETLIMTALEKRIGSYDKRGLAEGGSIGSFSGSSTVQSIIVLLTPVIVGD